MSRDPQKIFCYIKRIPVYEDEARVIVLCIFGLKTEEIAPFLGITLDQIKKLKAALFIRFNVHNCMCLTRLAEKHGFDVDGNYNHQPVFTQRELRLLYKMYPWAELEPATAC